MKPRQAPLEDPSEESDEPDWQEPAPRVAYRVSGDLQVRSAELEQQLAQAKDSLRALEREVYAARKVVRRRRALGATSTGGLGALLGAVVGSAIHASGVVDSPHVVSACALVAFVLGALYGYRWDDPDDGFPKAPPPRMPY
jgi:hypothetical protein